MRTRPISTPHTYRLGPKYGARRRDAPNSTPSEARPATKTSGRSNRRFQGAAMLMTSAPVDVTEDDLVDQTLDRGEVIGVDLPVVLRNTQLALGQRRCRGVRDQRR